MIKIVIMGKWIKLEDEDGMVIVEGGRIIQAEGGVELPKFSEEAILPTTMVARYKGVKVS